jgi:hypothetical protein
LPKREPLTETFTGVRGEMRWYWRYLLTWGENFEKDRDQDWTNEVGEREN